MNRLHIIKHPLLDILFIRPECVQTAIFSKVNQYKFSRLNMGVGEREKNKLKQKQIHNHVNG